PVHSSEIFPLCQAILFLHGPMPHLREIAFGRPPAGPPRRRAGCAPLPSCTVSGGAKQNGKRPRQPWSLHSARQALITFRPFLRRAARTLRPFFVLIRLRKPCTFLRLRLFG